MKRTSLLFISLVLILLTLCACSGAQSHQSDTPAESLPADTPTESMCFRDIQFPADTDWSSPVVETDTRFFYIAADGMYEYGKETKTTRRISEETVRGLYLYENGLYYMSEHAINRMDLQTGGSSVVWDDSAANNSDGYHYLSLNDFALADGYLYIAGTGTSVMRVSLEDGTTEQFLADCGSMVLHGNDCYYLDHAECTFSLYRMDCDSKESTLLRGTGQSEPGRDALRIDGIAGTTDSVAYSVRDASDVYLYHPDGSDEKIFDGDDSDQFWLFFVRRCPASRLCFYTTDGTQLNLYEYRPATGVELLTSFDCEERMVDIAVTETAVFWWSEAEKVTKHLT